MTRPEQIKIREVGPRDGFQNEPEHIPTPDKIRLIDALATTGLERIEVTSFVRADVIPQLADAREVLESISVPPDVALSVLIPNRRGLEHALEVRERFSEVGVFVSATDTHNKKNINRTTEETMVELETELIPRAREAGLYVEAVIAVAFGCPYEGHVPVERVLGLARRLHAAGADEIGFGDTTGMAFPGPVREFFAAATEALPDVELTAHFHNTRGQGLANVVAALDEGVTSFESSLGEMGGCPVPPGSTGNIATEDLVSMLHGMGYETGIDLEALLDVGRDLQAVVGRRLTSHVLTAGPVNWN